MKAYHVEVLQNEGWYVGRVLERQGVVTQGRTLDELIFRLRDASELMWGEKDVRLELLVPPAITGTSRRPGARPRARPHARARR